MVLIALLWINDNKKPAISNGFYALLDYIGFLNGGGGGNRTRVQKRRLQRAYMLSQRFESRTTKHPLTGFSSFQPINFIPPYRLQAGLSCLHYTMPDLKQAESPDDVAATKRLVRTR